MTNTGWQRLCDAGIPTAQRGAGRSTETIAQQAYRSLPAQDKALVDPWLALGNSHFDSLINSGVLARTTRKEQSIKVSPGRAEREVFTELPWQHKDLVSEWLAAGHDLHSALLESNVLGQGEPITPRQARAAEWFQRDQQEVSEHEASHCVVAAALGLDVISAKIADDGSGECTYVKGTKLQTAIVRMAGEIWIDQFRKSEFPYGAKGLEGDHRALAEISDAFVLRRALVHCTAILSTNREIVLDTATQILKYGQVVAPWQ